MTKLFYLLLFFCIPAGGQTQISPLFSSNSHMPAGAYYYPEHWPAEQWERDIKRIAELGFEFTHFAEFSWAFLEPEEGIFDFGWLDTCVALAEKYGLEVIMCTPGPTPPAWLTHNYPEVLLVNDKGVQLQHGGRLHANGMNETYQFYLKRLVQKMAERYGNHPTIAGWQIDNEPHFASIYDYSETAQEHFRLWLIEKYGTIEALNKAWGTPFWSQVYNNFDQIRIPNTNENAGGSPHSLIDFKRFTADEIAAYLRYQAEILEANVSTDQWITTNFAYYKFLPSVDPFRSKNDLDFASHTMYLLSTYLNYPKGELAHRLGSGMELSFSGELARSVSGITGVMELQPGQINWGQYNSRPLPGAVRMWVWHSFGLGDQFVCNYRFRQPLYGSEQFHAGILSTDGTSVSDGGAEFVQAIQEIEELPKISNPQIPDAVKSRRTAFLWNMDNLWDTEVQPQNNSWDQWQHWYTYYEILKTFGAPVEFITPDEKFNVEAYPYMVAPAHGLVNDALLQKWEKYVQEGGNLILSTRTGMKDMNGHLWEQKLQEPIWELIGAEIEFYDMKPGNQSGRVRYNDTNYSWNIWADILKPYEDVFTLATHDSEFYKDKSAVVHHTKEKGTVTYIGAWSTDGELERNVLREIYLNTGADILNLPRYVFTEWRDGYWVAVNYTSENIEAPLKDENTLIYGAKIVPPGGIAVWKE